MSLNTVSQTIWKHCKCFCSSSLFKCSLRHSKKKVQFARHSVRIMKSVSQHCIYIAVQCILKCNNRTGLFMCELYMQVTGVGKNCPPNMNLGITWHSIFPVSCTVFNTKICNTRFLKTFLQPFLRIDHQYLQQQLAFINSKCIGSSVTVAPPAVSTFHNKYIFDIYYLY